jgi:hypothetical protein
MATATAAATQTAQRASASSGQREHVGPKYFNSAMNYLGTRNTNKTAKQINKNNTETALKMQSSRQTHAKEMQQSRYNNQLDYYNKTGYMSRLQEQSFQTQFGNTTLPSSAR